MEYSVSWSNYMRTKPGLSTGARAESAQNNKCITHITVHSAACNGGPHCCHHGPALVKILERENNKYTQYTQPFRIE